MCALCRPPAHVDGRIRLSSVSVSKGVCVMKKLVLSIIALFALALAACAGEEVVKEVPVEVVVEKEVVKEVPVEKIVTQEVVKEVTLPGETVVVEKEVIREVQVPGETVVVEKEVVKEVPVEVVVEKEVVKEVEVIKERIVEVPGATVVEIKEVPVATFASFGEAPQLQQLAQAGKLPPVEQRLPKEPMVIGTAEIGRYGGDFRSFLPTPQVQWAMQLMNKTGFLRWSTDGNTIIPHVASKWEVSDDGMVYTFRLREGMRWSDGAPFTADDVMFQYEDIILDPRLTLDSEKRGGALFGEDREDRRLHGHDDLRAAQLPLPADTDAARHSGTEPARLAVRHPLLTRPLHQAVHPQARRRARRPLPRGRKRRASPAGRRCSSRGSAPLSIPERPTHRPWVVETSIRAKQYRAIRNAYFSGVDPAGNQLPYIDRLVFDQIPDPGIQSIKALAGRVQPV